MVNTPYPDLPKMEDLLSIQGLEHLSLFAKHAVSGPLAGYHRSPLKGFSVEFAEHKPYYPGDSLRRLDWKRLAKTDKMLLKSTDAETNLRCTVVVDRSGSMRTDRKLTFATLGTALIGEALGNQRDALGLVWMDDQGAQPSHACKTSRSHRMNLYAALLDELRTQPSEKSSRTPVSQTLHQLANSLPQRSMVVVFSDFWEPESASDRPWAELQKALEHLRQKNCWVLLFPVFGTSEHSLSGLDWGSSWTELVDSESGEPLILLPNEAQKRYSEVFERRLQALKSLQQPPQIQINDCLTNDHPLHALLPFFLAHQKMK
jgi:hypothetical protein